MSKTFPGCEDCWHNYHCPMPQEGYDYDPATCPYLKEYEPKKKNTAGECLRQRVIEAIKTVHDPEIPVNLYDLGIIYKVEVKEDNRVYLLTTFTAPNCPEVDNILNNLKETVEKVEGVTGCDMEITFEPSWCPEMIKTDEAKAELGYYELIK